MNPNNYKAILGESLSDKTTIVKEGGLKVLGVVYKDTLSPLPKHSLDSF